MWCHRQVRKIGVCVSKREKRRGEQKNVRDPNNYLSSLSLSIFLCHSVHFSFSLFHYFSRPLLVKIWPSLHLIALIFSFVIFSYLYQIYHKPASVSNTLAWAGGIDSWGITIAIGLSSDCTAAFNFIASLPIKSVCNTLYGGRVYVVVPYLKRKIIFIIDECSKLGRKKLEGRKQFIKGDKLSKK